MEAASKAKSSSSQFTVTCKNDLILCIFKHKLPDATMACWLSHPTMSGCCQRKAPTHLKSPNIDLHIISALLSPHVFLTFLGNSGDGGNHPLPKSEPIVLWPTYLVLEKTELEWTQGTQVLNFMDVKRDARATISFDRELRPNREARYVELIIFSSIGDGDTIYHLP